MSKILTPVIVREELEKDGIIFGLEGDNAKDVLLEEWGSNLDFNSSWAKGNESLLVYTQSTADGYDLYVCTETHGNDLYLATSPIIFGNSGGSLYVYSSRRTYELIGVPSMVSAYGWGSVVTHMGWARPISQIRIFLRVNNYGYILGDEPETEEIE